MHRTHRAAVIVAAAATMAALAAGTSAHAATAQSRPDQARLAQVAAAESAAAARLAAVSHRLDSGAIRPDTSVSLAEQSALGCDGVSAGAVAQFNDGTISYGWTSGQVYGDSWGYWFGSGNAQSMDLTDSYSINGPFAGWNNPGSGWNFSSDTLSFHMSGSNIWQLHHGEYEISWGGFPAWFSQNTSVNIYLPGVVCSPDASGTKYL